MGDREREHAVLAFHRGQLVDEAAHRLARGVEHADHAAVPGGHYRFGTALDRALHHREQVFGAVRDVDVGIFLEQDKNSGVAKGAVADIAMEVELDPDRDVGADDLADMGQHVAFAVVIALGDHRAVHAQEYRIDRHGRLEVRHDLVAERLVDLLHRLAGRHGEGAEALDDLPALGFAALPPDRERCAEHRHVLAVAALAIEAGVLEELVAGGNGGEGVGFGAETGGEDLFHGRTLAACGRGVSAITLCSPAGTDGLTRRGRDP